MFCKDGDHDELPEHYGVVLGDDQPGAEELQAFIDAFGPSVRRQST